MDFQTLIIGGIVGAILTFIIGKIVKPLDFGNFQNLSFGVWAGVVGGLAATGANMGVLVAYVAIAVIASLASVKIVRAIV